jgi:N-acetylglucosamine-6-sulfatase
MALPGCVRYDLPLSPNGSRGVHTALRAMVGQGANRYLSTKVVCLVFGMLVLGLLLTTSSMPLKAQEARKPNIIFILTDDMRKDELGRMPLTQDLLAAKGTTFNNAFVPYGTCCPSRASILRGQYTHNHNVWSNRAPRGGFEKFHSEGLEASTVATWLRERAGYHTVFLGKYLNEYPGDMRRSYVPPGWDEWYARLGPTNEYDYYDYDLNQNGHVVHYGTAVRHYYTDVLSRKARDYVSRRAPKARPFFMYLSVGAPHGPATPAKRHRDMFSKVPLPKPPSFNEKDVSDKPNGVRTKRRLDGRDIRKLTVWYRNRLRTLQAVDEMVAKLVSELRQRRELDSTYIFFTSDNGFHLGEHRLTLMKRTPYEEAIRVPLVVRGPDVPVGMTRGEFALNIDFAPTFADLARTTPPSFVDGRSLRPLLRRGTPSSWRTVFLLESNQAGRTYGVRTAQKKYVEYGGGFRELYDLTTDPYELNNGFSAANPAFVAGLESRLEALRTCAGQSCRDAEDGP